MRMKTPCSLNGRLIPMGRGERVKRRGSHTVAMDQNPPSTLDRVIDERLSPANEQDPFNRTRADRRGTKSRKHSRWKVPNEILFLRVR